MLAMVTGIEIPVCQAFHHGFFSLLEDVGDFDGLFTTPSVLVAGRGDRLSAACDWLAEHPAPDIDALLAADDAHDQPDDHIAQLVHRHSLDLALAADSNPSLTFGSMTALQNQLIDAVLDVMATCQDDEIDRLTEMAVAFLSRMPDSLRLVGDVTLQRTTAALPPLSV